MFMFSYLRQKGRSLENTDRNSVMRFAELENRWVMIQ